MKTMKLPLIMALMASITLSACSKGDKGDPGPQGPPGNANVLTINYSISPGNWIESLTAPLGPGDEGYFLYDVRNIPDITQEIIDFGLVAAYYHDNGFYLPLPYTKFYKETTPSTYLWQETLDMVISPGNCQINFTSSDFFTPEGSLQTIDIRLVIIDGYVRKQNPDLDWSNYTLVKEKLKIKD
jgi:hypothetical protein